MAKTNPKARKNMQPKSFSNKLLSQKIGINKSKIEELAKEIKDLKAELVELKIDLKQFLPREEEEEAKEIEEFEVMDRSCQNCANLDLKNKNCVFHVKNNNYPCRKWEKLENEKQEEKPETSDN